MVGSWRVDHTLAQTVRRWFAPEPSTDDAVAGQDGRFEVGREGGGPNPRRGKSRRSEAGWRI